MNPNKLIFVLSAILLLTVPIVFSAGGGGGGSSRSTAPACTEDTWSCSEWDACRNDNTQERECKLAVNCANIETPKPEEKASCTYVSELLNSLKCYNFDTINERVKCRLGLSGEQLTKELKIAYLPEECRAIKNIGKREACVLLYSKSQPCWSKPIGTERAACLKQVMGIDDIAKDKQACRNDSDCILLLKQKVYGLVKFRFYDFEERAEELYEDGAITLDEAAGIISPLEQGKVEFNQANSKEERKQVIIKAKTLWQDFISELGAGK